MKDFCLSVALLSLVTTGPAVAAEDIKAQAVLYAKQLDCPTYRSILGQVRQLGPDDRLFHSFTSLMQFIYRDVAGEEADADVLALFTAISAHVCEIDPDLMFYDAALRAWRRQ